MQRETKSRRNFITELLFGWLALSFLPILLGAVKYLIPPKLRDIVYKMIPVANAAQIPVNSAKVVKYYNKSVIILHTATGEFKAFSATCTHLGCNVSYEAPLQRFHCFCHDSIYDLNGKNVSGPARFPLAPYQIDIKNDQVNVAQV